MKRVALTILATVAGVLALLSFKTRGTIDSGGVLPAASLPASNPPAAAGPPAASSGSSGSSAASAAGDTTYLGTAEHTPYGIVQVRAEVAGSRIVTVSLAQLTAFDPRSQQINSYAAPILLRETLSAQSARIDSVSGASYTSDGYTKSLQSALDQAGH
jgi:uncharacterized protein with FMN-binding domain